MAESEPCNAAVLVHCGAGVSRSATLVVAYLMRRFTWPAERARAHCLARRSLVNPNQGFWRQLCAFEAELGITQRCAQPQKTHPCLEHVVLVSSRATNIRSLKMDLT